MAVTVSVDTHYSCVVLSPKTTALVAILIARHLPMRFFFLLFVCLVFSSFSVRVGDGESGRIRKIGGCLGSGGGLIPQ